MKYSFAIIRTFETHLRVKGHPLRASALPGGRVLESETSIVIIIYIVKPAQTGEGGLKISIFAEHSNWTVPKTNQWKFQI